jgi:hypothetical protein
VSFVRIGVVLTCLTGCRIHREIQRGPAGARSTFALAAFPSVYPLALELEIFCHVLIVNGRRIIWPRWRWNGFTSEWRSEAREETRRKPQLAACRACGACRRQVALGCAIRALWRNPGPVCFYFCLEAQLLLLAGLSSAGKDGEFLAPQSFELNPWIQQDGCEELCAGVGRWRQTSLRAEDRCSGKPREEDTSSFFRRAVRRSLLCATGASRMRCVLRACIEGFHLGESADGLPAPSPARQPQRPSAVASAAAEGRCVRPHATGFHLGERPCFWGP